MHTLLEHFFEQCCSNIVTIKIVPCKSLRADITLKYRINFVPPYVTDEANSHTISSFQI